ncbi:hypothetical protein B0T20DRAFT_427331 [Sordaria brevicollis]|uniref:DUF7136 domain-containing protein n=1 Tax=Sordaria brevicollis TaxID=83679 RepID=A0AAE0U0E0_SORBR|nr:hypothetical protein B0T20DRAFT_427331 [Sordaria brevicollis]
MTTLNTTFTIKKDGQKAELVLASDPETCASKTQSMAVHILNEVWMPTDLNSFMDLRVCGNVSSEIPPATPCKANLDQAAAVSLAAELRASACASGGCPTASWGHSHRLELGSLSLCAAMGAGLVTLVQLVW